MPKFEVGDLVEFPWRTGSHTLAGNRFCIVAGSPMEEEKLVLFFDGVLCNQYCGTVIQHAEPILFYIEEARLATAEYRSRKNALIQSASAGSPASTAPNPDCPASK